MAADGTTTAQFKRTEGTLAALNAFVDERDVAKLPRRLARDLGTAQLELSKIAEQRTSIQTATADVVQLIAYYSGVSPAERRALNKPAQPHLALRFKRQADSYRMELIDDGRGIAWERLANKARKLGLPVESEADRLEVLFTDGVSSRDEVSDQSGRGVGMAP